MIGMAVAFVIWIVALGVVMETYEAVKRLWWRWTGKEERRWHCLPL